MDDLKVAFGLSEEGPYRAVTVALLAGAVGLAVTSLAAWSLGYDAFLLTVALAFALVGLACLASLNLAESRGIRRLLAGEYWVHWRYAPDEWQAIVTSEAERASEAGSQAPWIIVANAAILGLLVVTFGGAEASFWLVAAGSIGVSLLVQILTSRTARERASEHVSGGGEVCIGPRAVLQRPGPYSELSGFSSDLVNVELEHGERLTLRFVTAPPRRDHSALRSELRVVVPRGQETAAEELVDRFRADLAAPGGA